ncbi:MAG: transporter substrate-binding domain-containing protein [Marinobacter sp.]|nr:transporter substrate-binding domain-containing protein [Marinobacter sp.]
MIRRLGLLGMLLGGSIWVGASGMDDDAPLVCYSTVYPPYVLENDGGIAGIDVDVVRELGRRLDREIDIRLEPWNRLERDLRQGKRDCVFSYFHTPAREAYARFTGVPMHVTQYTLFYNPDAFPDAHSLKDFVGRRIGVNRGFRTTPAFSAAREAGQIEVVEVNEDAQSLSMLALGRIDAVLTNYDVGQYLIQSLKLPHLRALKPPLSTTPAYLVLSRDPALDTLAEKFDWALFQILKDGTYADIRARYMPASGATD